MLQQVEVWPEIGGVTPLVLDIDAVDPDSVVLITSISGLDPADVTLFTGEYARDGGYYQGRRSGQRNVVLNLKLNPDYANDVAVSDIREDLYVAFMDPSHLSDGVRLVLKDDRRPDRQVVGYVEKFPTEIFSKETTAQISLLCPNPFIHSVALTEGDDVAGWATLPHTYAGSAKTGVEVELLVKTATTELFFEINGDALNLANAFAVDDVISINTNPGSRFIRQNGSDIMARLVAGSKWPVLRRGENSIATYGTVGNDGKVVMTHYEYKAAWWGA